MADIAGRQLLGGLTAAVFLRRYWQKKPLLVRRAVDGFHGGLSRAELFALAGRDDVESRLIQRVHGRWTREQGPFRSATLRALPARDWTLLVQGVNLHAPAADVLLRRFAFIPYARLDDVMVSCAAPGGGVGPHVDSYDVFLLQGEGRRRWRIATRPDRESDLALDPSMPIKILARFRPDVECTVDPGDMLYLPPDHSHDGIAVDACTTYSIGFRAPSAQELATAFLDWMRDSIALEGRYADPSLSAAIEPARIGEAMRKQCSAMLADVRWDNAAVSRFLGCYLSEPKPSVFFAPRSRPPGRAVFRSTAARRGIALDRRTQLLYDKTHGFINGAAFDWPGPDTVLIERLANDRRLTSAALSARKPLHAATAALFYRWYCDGFLHFG